MNRGRLWQRLGMPLWAVVGLAVLALPRAVAHDLGPVDPAANALLTFVPMVIWVTVVLWQRVPNPFLTLVVVGAVYGLLLGFTHVLLWDRAFDGDPPALGGNLEGALPSAVEAVVLRGFSVVSSLVTGAIVGAAVGVVAWVLARLIPQARQESVRPSR